MLRYLILQKFSSSPFLLSSRFSSQAQFLIGSPVTLRLTSSSSFPSLFSLHISSSSSSSSSSRTTTQHQSPSGSSSLFLSASGVRPYSSDLVPPPSELKPTKLVQVKNRNNSNKKKKGPISSSSTSQSSIVSILLKKTQAQLEGLKQKDDKNMNPEYSPETVQALKKMLENPHVKTIGKIFQEHGYQIRFVGGMVRDLLLGRDPKDVDFATTATPTQMIEMFEQHKVHYIPTGVQHGTLTVVLDHVPFEITTLRVDTDHTGRHAQVEFVSDWQLDAARRDLTINAMSIDLEGTLYDYFDGISHLTHRRVLFVGDAAQRITEDYLRILRYFRFHARVSEVEQHDTPTLEAISKYAFGLEKISGERLWLEMSKILVGPRAAAVVGTMLSTGVLRFICLPSVKPHHLDALHALESYGMKKNLEVKDKIKFSDSSY